MDILIVEELYQQQSDIKEEINETADQLASARSDASQIYLSSVLTIMYTARRRNARLVKMIEDNARRYAD